MFDTDYLIEKEIILKEIFVTRHTQDKWRKVIPLMGEIPDKKIAKKIGVTTSCVASVRTKLRIRPVTFPPLCVRYGAILKYY